MGKTSFSPKELLLLNTIEKYVDLPNWEAVVASKLGYEPVTVRTKMYRLRSKYKRALNFIEAYKKWRETLFKKSGGAWRHL